MSTVSCEINAVTKLAFVADAYPYGNDDTIVVVLKPALRESLPLNRSILKFKAANFTANAVIETYEREVVCFLNASLRNAERLLAKSVPARIHQINSLCLN